MVGGDRVAARVEEEVRPRVVEVSLHVLFKRVSFLLGDFIITRDFMHYSLSYRQYTGQFKATNGRSFLACTEEKRLKFFI